MSTARTTRVLVLAGGPSAEREVSLTSGKAVGEALKRRGHQVTVADISPGNLAALDTKCDVAFSLLHGTFGEDGQLQSILEQRDIRFVGSDSRASALAIDKASTKEKVRSLGVDTPAFAVATSANLASLQPPAGYPLVVKPVDQGSSVATFIVNNTRELSTALDDVTSRFGRALIEQFIAGPEITAGILFGQPLPLIRIQPRGGFYDYAAKYEDDATEYLFETGLSAQQVERLRGESVRIYEAIGCRHLARVDWIVDAGGRAWFLEINTLPGFTSHSLLPKAAARAGIDFDELAQRLVLAAWEGRP